MTKKRHSIDTIAEVLIDKLSDMEKTAKRIELAANQEIKVDVKALENLLENKEVEERKFLESIKKLQEKNEKRIPTLLFYAILFSFIASIGYSFFIYKKIDEYGIYKSNAEFWKNEWVKLNDSLK